MTRIVFSEKYLEAECLLKPDLHWGQVHRLALSVRSIFMGALGLSMILSTQALAEPPCRLEFEGKEISCKEFLNRKLAPKKKEETRNTHSKAKERRGPGGHVMRNGLGFGGINPYATELKGAQSTPLPQKKPMEKLRVQLYKQKIQLQKLRVEPRRWEEAKREALVKKIRSTTVLLERLTDEMLPEVVRCAKRLGIDLQVRRIRQTTDGAVRLTYEEMMKQMEQVPYGCRVEDLLSKETLGQHRRLQELQERLDEGPWTWNNREQYASLKKEIVGLQKKIETERQRRTELLN